MSEPIGSVAIALNVHQAAGPREQWVHLTPVGPFAGRDGRTWRISERVITATNRRQGQALPVDYEHQTDNAPKNGQPAPAAGWIRELAPRADGVWGRVEWTARAAAMIADREYRFISPVFLFRPETGEVTALLRAALTNDPNLELVALSRARHGADMSVDNLANELRQLLGLDAEAGFEDIVTGVRSVMAANDAAASNRPDPSQYVPMAVFQQVTSELNLRNQDMSEELALNYVELQISQQRLMPFLKDWAVALCKTNRPAFDDFVTKTGGPTEAFATMLSAPSRLGRKPPGGQTALSDSEVTVARVLGHTADEMIAANRRTEA